MTRCRALAMTDQTIWTAASEHITVAVIGLGGMETNHTNLLAARKDVRVKYVCGVDQQRLATAAEAVRSTRGQTPEHAGDVRSVFDDKEVDAVFIAIPDHWHAPAANLALDAGKHVYVEPPCCLTICEGRLLADAVARSGKCLQLGRTLRAQLAGGQVFLR